MNRTNGGLSIQTWFPALLLSAVLAGCGGGGGDGIGNQPPPPPPPGETVAPTVTATVPLAQTPPVTGVAINSKITVSFSEEMDPLTINDGTIRVACPAGTAITGTVDYVASGSVATFTPDANLPANVTCNGAVTTGVEDLAGNAMADAFSWSFTTSAVADSAPPTVSSTTPVSNATGVALNTLIIASFSEPMDPLTITDANFTVVCPAGTAITGAVSYASNGNAATFTPAGDLPGSTTCTARIGTGVTDLAGNAKASVYAWNFTTGATADTTSPSVSSTIPLANAIGVALNSLVTASFSEPMDPLTINNVAITLACPVGTAKGGTVGYAVNGNTATFTPSGSLPAGTTCRATITTAVTDVAGNAMASAFGWNFTTGAILDTTGPTITLESPANLDTGVARNAAINATFSENMDPSTITTSNFKLQLTGPPLGPNLTGTMAYVVASRIATFTPSSLLAASSSFTATVTNGAEDLAGNPLVAGLLPNPWRFTTGTGLAPGAIALNSAASFGIMATSAITSTGNTVINGDVSLDPGTSQTGFPPGIVNGTVHINDTVSQQARDDLLVAFNDAKGLPPGTTISGGANLGALFPLGMPPGTYTSGSTMLVSTPLVLDAGGNANAVWVFQIGSSLTTGASVTLANGAQAKNVFWVPTSDATIGVGTTFNGTILAGRDVTAVTGARINGRILAGAILAGTIALQNATINVPAP